MIPLDKERFNVDTAGVVEDGCTSDYILHEGLLAIPVMGEDETPPVIVRTHAAYTERRVDFRYARNKVPPLIPTPGDTLSGDIYLGGNIRLGSPTQEGEGYLVYTAVGNYNFVATSDLRTKGKVAFDAHGYLSLVDFLGYYNINPHPPTSPGEPDDVWQSRFFDLNYLASARILG